MLDIGWSELLVVVIVAIVVVGPKDLPKLMRTLGIYAGKLRRAAGDFQRQFDEAMAESEADEVAKNIEAIRANMGTTADFGIPPGKPLMTPAPHSIEQAIAPQGQRAAKRKAPAKKTPAKRKAPAKRKTVAKRKTSAKRKPGVKPKAKSRATKKATRRSATRTATRTRKRAKTRPKR